MTRSPGSPVVRASDDPRPRSRVRQTLNPFPGDDSMRYLTALLLAVTAPLAGAQDTTSARNTPASIAVSGRGEHSVKPDQVTVQLAVNTRARTASRAGQDNADRMTAVRQALRGLGFPDSAITTSFYQIRFETMDPRSRDTAYVATNAVRVTTKQLELASRIIDTALEAGATTVSGVFYSASDTKDARQQALAAAVADARTQAEAVASAAGGRLGELLEMNAQQSMPRPVQYMQVRVAGATEGAATPVMPGMITVSATVNARWRFVPAR